MLDALPVLLEPPAEPAGTVTEAVANAPTPESAGEGSTIVVAAVASATNALMSFVAGDAGALMALR